MYMEKKSNHRLQVLLNIMDTNNNKKKIDEYFFLRINFSFTSDDSWSLSMIDFCKKFDE